MAVRLTFNTLLPMPYLYFRSIYLFHVIPSSCLSSEPFTGPQQHFVSIIRYLYSYYFPKGKGKGKKVYIGISSVRWKLGYNNHIHSFSHERLKNQTTLSKHFWKSKNRGLIQSFNGKFWKDPQLLSALMEDVIYIRKKRYKLCSTLILLTYWIRDGILLLDVGIKINLDFTGH